ncbi:hypothetical protein BDD12DRAFT_880261 [Trichophaea hybrida]|nr:hypothetical protein BDD12DRAFT_880261 [Trichophaea hybrida]
MNQPVKRGWDSISSSSPDLTIESTVSLEIRRTKKLRAHSPPPSPSTSYHRTLTPIAFDVDVDSPMVDLPSPPPDMSQPQDLDMGGYIWDQQPKKPEQGEGGEEKKKEGEKKETLGAAQRFRMGFQAGCEKCRLRVPGHYSHF